MYIVTKQIVRYKQGNITYTVAELECDTIGDLPLPTGNEQPGVGSRAHVVSDNSIWAYKSTGQWVMQEAGTAGYTKEEVDQLIQDTKDYADGEILGAINDLDVSSVGGTTRYIYQISQSNGKISANSYLSDSTPTTGSTKLVQSGGVKTYVDNAKTAANNYTDTQVATKASVSQIYGIGTQIESGTDLNNITTAGVYTCPTVTIANTLTNMPVSGSAFRLEVKYLNNATRIRQEFYLLSELSTYYVRTYTSTGWKPWYMFSGTLVETQSLNNQVMSVNPVNRINSVNDEEME